MERRDRQNLNLEEPAWHRCNPIVTTRGTGWIPDLWWETRISLRLNQNFKSPVREIRMRESVRVLSFTNHG
jgi:hypothetical protein